MDYKNLSLIELGKLIKSGKTTSEEIYNYFLERTKKYNGELNVFNTFPLDFIPENNLSDSLWNKKLELWLPIAVKDIFCEKGIRTTASSKMLENFVPPYESTVTERMKSEGFIWFGKTNMDEFAMGGSGESSVFGPTRNPWDLTRIPGWSSSGSAVAVAAGLVPAALGTDTGGSIRQPASMCGIVGFKPGYGRNSRYGVMAMASSLDTPGYFTRTVRDAWLLYETTAWYDHRDSTSLTAETTIDPDIWTKINLKWVRVGIAKEYQVDGIDPGLRSAIDSAIAKIRELGAEVIDISLPHTEHGISAYYTICPAEVASNLARYDGIRFGELSETGGDITLNRSESLGDEIQRRSLVWSYVLSSWFYDAYFLKATAVRELIRQDFAKAFELVDVIVTPTAPTVAWKIGAKGTDPLALYLEDIFTIPASLAGIPGLTIPVGFASPTDDSSIDLPVGLQILGPLLWEEKVLMVGNVIEMAMKSVIISKKPKIW